MSMKPETMIFSKYMLYKQRQGSQFREVITKMYPNSSVGQSILQDIAMVKDVQKVAISFVSSNVVPNHDDPLSLYIFVLESIHNLIRSNPKLIYCT